MLTNKINFLLVTLLLTISISVCGAQSIVNRGVEDSWSANPRILLLIVDPVMQATSGKKLTEHYGWNDPVKLTEEFIRDIKTSTHGQVTCEVAETIVDNEWPPFLDNLPSYTGETFIQDWEGPRKFQGKCDYAAILRKHGVREKVEIGLIDEVWMFGFPGMGCYETCMAGEGAIWCNGPVIEAYHCSRAFVVYAFNYERGVDCMLENLGHRAESMLGYIFRDAPSDNPWARFTRYEKTHPGEAACGNVHFAPNSVSDYDWGNTAYVDSTCDDWAVNFPDLNGLKKTVNAEEWGNGDMRLHHIWWFSRFPHHAGDFEGKLANWWKYIFTWNSCKNL